MAVAECVIDECTFECETCSAGVCEAEGQECEDPNDSADVLGDWVCKCMVPETGMDAVGRAADCIRAATPEPTTPTPTQPPAGLWQLGEFTTDVTSMTIYENSEMLPELAGRLEATLVAWPEAVVNATDAEEYTVVVKAGSLGGKVAIQPEEYVITCCDVPPPLNFTVYGLAESVDYIEISFAPHADGNATSGFPSVSALWKSMSDIIVMTVGPTQLALQGYQAFKGEYPMVFSEPFEAVLSRTPEFDVNLTVYVEGGAGFYEERTLVVATDVTASGNATDATATTFADDENVTGTEEDGAPGPVPEYDVTYLPNIEVDVNPLQFRGKEHPSGGTRNAAFRILCRTPGTYWIRFQLSGDVALKYAGLDGFNHTCIDRVDLAVEYLDALPPYAGSQSKQFQVSLGGRHRDYQDFGLEITCAAYDTVTGVLSDAFIFYPRTLPISSGDGGRFTAESSAAGAFSLRCSTGGNPDFNEPPAVPLRVLPQIEVALPAIDVIRVLNGAGGFSNELTLDIKTAPRVAFEVTPIDESGSVVSIPEVLQFAPGVASATFRLQAAETFRRGEVASGAATLTYEFAGADALHYVTPEDQPDGATDVVIQGPNADCANATTAAACGALWADMCWWEPAPWGGGDCRNDLIPLTFPSAVDGAFRSQYHLMTGTQSVALTAPPQEWVGVRFVGEDMVYPMQDVRWTRGDAASKSFTVRSTAERLEDTRREVEYELFGADFHHYAPPPPTNITILTLLKVLTPTTPDVPFLYVNSRSRLITVTLEKAPPARLTLTPVLYSLATGAPTAAASFEPEMLVFTPETAAQAFRIYTTAAMGTFRIQWEAAGDTMYFREPLAAQVKVFASNSISSLAPLATLAPFEWSPTQWLQMGRLPEEPTRVRVSSDNPFVVFRPPPLPGAAAAEPSPTLDVVFTPGIRTTGFQVMGPYPGRYYVETTPLGEEAANFEKPAPQWLHIQEAPVWYSVPNQFGVDPVCRVNVGRTLYHHTGLADATDETCRISDVLDTDALCVGASLEQDCTYELASKGHPCVWYPDAAGTGGRCVYGLPSGNVTHWSVSETHSIFRLYDGSVWTAGKNEFGQLGHSCFGTQGCKDSLEYKEVLFEDRDFRGKCSQFTTDPTSKQQVCKQFSAADLTDNGFMDYAVAVAAGASHSMTLTAGGRLYTWGSNYHGQLGIEDTTIQMAVLPTRVATPERPLVESITCITAGAYHSVVMVDTGRLYTWGWNYHGQLGDWDSYRESVRTPVAITDNVTLWEEDPPVSVAAGQYHTVLATESGKVYTWGRNNYGQLGRVGFDETDPQLADESAPPGAFLGGSCDPEDMVNWDSWPEGTDFTLGRREPSIYERAADNTAER
eukprot:TRINITY_DN84_c0_g1_i1.p1 TRINITY_DN84_c0_g1~~TRINITY_DN84_c0_g1_i1.p1  ORF type:complete len:1355 (+),score=482.56 TRINITY_DN84_c0_g1_i1:700-4764(+)